MLSATVGLQGPEEGQTLPLAQLSGEPALGWPLAPSPGGQPAAVKSRQCPTCPSWPVPAPLAKPVERKQACYFHPPARRALLWGLHLHSLCSSEEPAGRKRAPRVWSPPGPQPACDSAGADFSGPCFHHHAAFPHLILYRGSSQRALTIQAKGTQAMPVNRLHVHVPWPSGRVLCWLSGAQQGQSSKWTWSSFTDRMSA